MNSVADYIVTLLITLVATISIVIVVAIMCNGVTGLLHRNRGPHDSPAGSPA